MRKAKEAFSATKEHNKDTKRKEASREDYSRSASRERETNHDQDVDNHQQQRQKSQGQSQRVVLDYGYRSRSMPRDQEILEETHESRETTEDKYANEKRAKNDRTREQDSETSPDRKDGLEDKQAMWDRKREELERMSRKMSQAGIDELKGKEYSTFRVSFGRTESKAKKSLSPDSKAVATIMDVPRKKRVDHVLTKFNVITGGDVKISAPQTTRADGGKSIKFLFEDGYNKSGSAKKLK